jgi:hypothetical protein
MWIAESSYRLLKSVCVVAAVIAGKTDSFHWLLKLLLTRRKPENNLL